MSLAVGHSAEHTARRFLETNGLQFLEKNYRCKAGEIDLIMKDQDQTVFVEVRYRKADDFGTAAETISRQKQLKIIRAAKHYLIFNEQYEKISCRFDVVTFDGKIEWIPNAFYAG